MAHQPTSVLVGLMTWKVVLYQIQSLSGPVPLVLHLVSHRSTSFPAHVHLYPFIFKSLTSKSLYYLRSPSTHAEHILFPLNPTFSGGESPPPMVRSEIVFGPLDSDYSPASPGAGTSTSFNVPTTQGYATGERSSASNRKQYSFVSLPGNVTKKRPRRRYDEIRLYQCSWQNCMKAYGTLNHLNAHIGMQKHGPKRSPDGELKLYSPSTIPEHTLTSKRNRIQRAS